MIEINPTKSKITAQVEYRPDWWKSMAIPVEEMERNIEGRLYDMIMSEIRKKNAVMDGECYDPFIKRKRIDLFVFTRAELMQFIHEIEIHARNQR